MPVLLAGEPAELVGVGLLATLGVGELDGLGAVLPIRWIRDSGTLRGLRSA